ncbi:5-methylcytosine-specific restriction enzyme subunit McrC [Neorhizobium galegae bv. officinalis]|uniref:5-methylcytosine-specific restriction enzyme subunit McrC n=1 Tax=Neorhizobium galegae bv. officinalis TaxID=323656 RepID=A0A0T7FKS7_NEOGA|nr:5-methylcytosine-specific restriction endonuclease system specificity protein McrC [Neorhizobium galegae]CDZ35594.1 5-methylcytosine-specific restriction enzyme subunit McrC [Neorhizobium galegae bv. officinalis]
MTPEIAGAAPGAGTGTWSSRSGIPIRNLWILLVYAAGLAGFEEPTSAGIDDEAKLSDVLARLLAHVVERRLRRNLSRGYKGTHEVLNRVRGRIDWLRTESALLLNRGQIACRFDDLTHDTARNRLVLSALVQMGAHVKNRDVAQHCRSLGMLMLAAGVAPLRPTRAELSRDRMSGNDCDDVLMVRVAELALDLVLPTEAAGSAMANRLEREEYLLRRIFEDAVAGFYRHELDGRDGWKIRSQATMQWHQVDATAGLGAILPSMRADVILQQRRERRIVLDTKFTRILTKRQHGQDGLKSAHLYQIYSYLRTQTGRGDQCADTAEGVLLHPSLDYHVDEAASIQGHRLRFVTVDLTASASELRQSLLDVVKPC